ncbi:MAG: prolyl oligopeptidase family serine peptidase [Atopobiaceae bacterium]|nr:prolyl oligopeptidase family serine peptidase [Atopobiaceae bacterium]
MAEHEASPDALERSGEEYRGFELDDVLHSATEGDTHFCMKVPEDYDGSHPYALFVTLPGWEGLYFQGVGANLEYEDFGVVANEYVPDMIVVAPQLSDWGETSARQTLALVHFMMDAYNIDQQHVYLQGYSGGGVTGSLVMGMEPNLFTAFLHCSSQWDSDLDVLAAARVPIRLSIGEGDEYYGPDSARQAAEELRRRYADARLSEAEIDRLVVLDVKPSDFFASQGITNQHGGGAALFAHDAEIMGWLFGQRADK